MRWRLFFAQAKSSETLELGGGFRTNVELARLENLVQNDL